MDIAAVIEHVERIAAARAAGDGADREDADWVVTLGANRELTIAFPDGPIHNTGPPTRTAA